MKAMRWLGCMMLLALLCGSTTFAQKQLTDPYQILTKSFDAMGGLDKLKAESTSIVDGNLALAGLNGTIKIWQKTPGKSRADVDLGILTIKQGDNGEYRWVIDQNGKLQKITKDDEITKQRRKLSNLMEEYDYADPHSSTFKVTLRGIDTAAGKPCYVLDITNTLNNDSTTYFIDTTDFLRRKTVTIAGDESSDSYTSDYREVNGLMVPFKTREIPHQSGQEQTITITTYESDPPINDTIFDPPGQSKKDFTFTNDDKSENINIKMVGNHLMVPVTVNCKERWWILDSGAGTSVVDKAFADELGLKLEGDMKGVGAGNRVDMSFARVPGFTVKGVTFDEQTMAVIDMADLQRLFGMDFAGILGYDFLSRFVTKVDFANETMSLYDPETFKYTGDGHTVDLHLKGGVFEVDATLDGKYTGTWLFDLGASGIALRYDFAVSAGYDKKPFNQGMGSGAGGRFIGKSVKSETVDFAGYTLDNLRVGFYSSGAQTAQLGDRLGILGNNLFRNFVLYLDYAHERVIVEQGDKFDQPWPEDHSGLQIAIGKTNPVEVIYVSPGTPADKAGFKEGDVITAINDIPVGLLDGVIAIRKVFQKEPGTTVQITVNRDGSEKTLKLKLKKLL